MGRKKLNINKKKNRTNKKVSFYLKIDCLVNV